MSVFDGEYLEIIWVVFQRGFEGTNVGVTAQKLNEGVLASSVSRPQALQMVSIFFLSKLWFHQIWPFQASMKTILKDSFHGEKVKKQNT